MDAKIEANISSCKAKPHYAPRAKDDTKPKKIHNVDPTQDTITPWAQCEDNMNALPRNQTLVMNKITNLERSLLQAPKPPFKGHPQRASQAWIP